MHGNILETDTREIRDKQSDVSVICREMVVGARSMEGSLEDKLFQILGEHLCLRGRMMGKRRTDML